MSIVRRSLMNSKTSAGNYIVFEDPAVEAICVANWSSDGRGLTYEDAAAVTNIGTVFKGNTSIVYFNEFQYFTNITQLAHNNFESCTNLKEITLPASCIKTVNPYYGNNGTFRYCSSLEKVTAEGIIEIAMNTFRDCTSLSELVIPQATTLGANSFNNSGALNGELNGVSVINIDGTAISSSLFGILKLPNYVGTLNIGSMTNIEEVYADKITTLTSSYTVNTKIKAIYCKNLTSSPAVFRLSPRFNTDLNGYAIMPKVTGGTLTNGTYQGIYFQNMQILTNGMFYYTTSTLLDFGDSLVNIGNGSQYNYPLTNWPENVMNALTIVVRATTPPTMDSHFNNYNPGSRMPGKIYVPAGTINSYLAATRWSDYAGLYYEIGGIEWIAQFGSADEWADYPNGVNPFIN